MCGQLKNKAGKYISGEEIAYRTLMREKVEEPCIIASWCMKREFFSYLSGDRDIYRNAPATAVKAFIKAGANLCPQFIMPSPKTEHLAVDPFNPFSEDFTEHYNSRKTFSSPEDVRDYIENLTDAGSLKYNFDMDSEIKKRAEYFKRCKNIAKDRMLFIGGFATAGFGGYDLWGFENFLLTTLLYPEHIKRYYDIEGEKGRLHNIATSEAIKKYDLAPFVYAGDDICFNNGSMISVESLKKLYFPALKKAVQPLHDAGIKIIWHCDGDVRPIIDILINDIGVDGFQGFQEETGCTLKHMSLLKTRNGDKPLLWGSVSVTTTLPLGTAESVKKDVERCFDTAGKEGFALGSTSSILPETPLENILALYEHGSKYGKQFLKGII